jgi:RNA polymerase sigma-70 factor, ECF subfamily
VAAVTPLGEGMVESVFREVHGHAVATLVRAFGDITVAEDAVQDTFVVAMRRWPLEGIPSNPAGWIVTTASNCGIDQLRRTNRGQTVQQQLDRQSAGEHSMVSADAAFANDDRLRLIFTCCHPALRTDHQVALTLRLLGGLSVEQIARRFVVSDAAMAKRLVRAKFKIKSANIPYRVPAPKDLSGRLRPVLSVLYLVYTTETTTSTAGRCFALKQSDWPEAPCVGTGRT